ncbi:hypothetical protein L2750_01925 [Shewanella submarina]|uniref:Chemotaxis methyl-accepting receptor HlyB-like 4HB MCP domain-containing protein n=1 Tax=Shewanella submarina TaxID=2016376 RepID=A0ABV7GMA7_9GAMM|nr:hypothetical protein [Shewanella submarina]MCL1035918.1 hypothetical protein [Shewanella submarina]
MAEEQEQVTVETKAKPQIKLDNRELTKTSFWVGQIFMMLATVLGVFLAAQEGLSQAIAFDNLTNKQSNYYLRRSLYDEVQDNVAVVEAYANMLKTNPPYDLKNNSPAMGTFIWENMKYSPFTLETPTPVLSEIRRYYLQVDDIVQKIETRTIGSRFGAGKLLELNQSMTDTVLPELKTSYEKLETSLTKAGMTLE